MINRLRTAMLAGSAVLAVSLGATSANAATATATATANIVQAITITQNAGLNFGTIVPAASAATVAISTAGARTCGGSLTCSGSVAAGAFTATGTGGMTVLISSDASTSIDDGAGGGAPMSVTGLTVSAASAVLSGGGSTTFTVGGTLNVGATQVAGVYNGTYNVNVSYQ
jgi:hypothetical protein